MQPFKESTISEVMAFLMKNLQIKLDTERAFESQWDKYLFHCNLVKEKITVSTYDNIKQTHSLLEYLIAVHGIFI